MTSTAWTRHEDVHLVMAIANGDREALATLYDAYSPIMLATAHRMLGDRREAEDILHDVFLEVWRKAGTYEPSRARVKTWLLMRLRSRVLDRLRSARRNRTVLTGDSRQTLSTDVAADDPSLAPDRATVRKALSGLPASQRAVLELSYFRGLSSSEIAAEEDIPVGTVKSRTAAALAKLRLGLGSEEGSP
ncbi:MAG: sigma-70 family RNA polymerase sigma factor [Myxococcota bacterium]